jgi:hypothetical protein
VCMTYEYALCVGGIFQEIDGSRYSVLIYACVRECTLEG